MGKPPPRRPLSAEDLRLWREVARKARPLRPQPPAEEASPEPVPVAPAKPGLRKYRSAAARKEAAPAAIPQEAPLLAGEFRNVDARTATRVRRGRYAIGCVLDLHGLNRQQARAALMDTVKNCYETKKRCILVVTGKGTPRVSGGEGGKGVLKELLPQWLNDDTLKPWLLGFETARPEHGGEGAFYLLIRRRR